MSTIEEALGSTPGVKQATVSDLLAAVERPGYKARQRAVGADAEQQEAELYPIWGITLDPILAAAAMAASSVTVVANALRLRGFRRPAGGSA